MFLIVSGRVFQRRGAAAANALSPSVERVLHLGGESRNMLFDLRL